MNSVVNTIRLRQIRFEVRTKLFFKAFELVANLHFNMIFYFTVKETVIEVCFIFVTVDYLQPPSGSYHYVMFAQILQFLS